MAVHYNPATGHDPAAGHSVPVTVRATRLAARAVGIMALAGSLTGIVLAGAARTSAETAPVSRAAAYTDCPWDSTFS